MAQQQEVKSAVHMQFSALLAKGYEANEAAARAILYTRNAKVEDACVFFPSLEVTVGAVNRVGQDTEFVDPAKFQQHTLKAVVQKRFFALIQKGLACNAAAAQAILETRGKMVGSTKIDEHERVRCVAIAPDATEDGRQLVEANEAAAGTILQTRRTQQKLHRPPTENRHANMESFKAAVHDPSFVLLHEGHAANEVAAGAIHEAAGALPEDARCLVSLPRVEACEPAPGADIEASHECMESQPCLERRGTMPAIDDTMHRHDLRERVQTFFFASVRDGLDVNEAAARAILEANCALNTYQVADTTEAAVYPLPIAAEGIEDAKLVASLPKVEPCEPEARDDAEARPKSQEISQRAYAIDERMQRHYFRECVHTFFFASVRKGLDANEAAARAIVAANGALKKYRLEGCTELFKRLLHIVWQAPENLQLCSNASEGRLSDWARVHKD